jgi:hypothetical protein
MIKPAILWTLLAMFLPLKVKKTDVIAKMLLRE